jgi:cysteine synthase A
MTEPQKPCCRAEKDWIAKAIRRIRADMTRSADTHLVRLPLSPRIGAEVYFKDESTHPTGSLKHRLARSLFLYAICNGWVGPDTPVVEASSGSTAVSEAYFARLLGLKFIAVMPRTTSPSKVELIRFHGGDCHFVDRPEEVYAAAAALAAETRGHYMDQFTYAERATDWRGNNNIAESIFDQLRAEDHPVPDWIVCGAGTGGTSATIGRYIRYNALATRVCLADPESSIFHQHLTDRSKTSTTCRSTIEGIGRGRLEPSFIPEQIDRWVPVKDADSIAAARWLSLRLGRRVGGSTGTNLIAVAELAAEMQASGTHGAIVTLLCDSGERYGETYFDDGWIAGRGFDLSPATALLDRVFGPA